MAAVLNRASRAQAGLRQHLVPARRLAGRQFIALYLARRRRKHVTPGAADADTLTVDSTLVTVDAS